MAGNEWLAGYLDAVLDTGPSIEKKSNENNDSATRFFLKEITGSNELDLHRTWLKATSLKNSQERGTRVENFCWRIWHMTRIKKQMHWEDATRLAHRRVEKDEAGRDASEDMPEELQMEDSELPSETGGVDDSNVSESTGEDKKLYIVLVSLHGLVRGDNMELGRDSDTGGQIKYVVEFARALAVMPQVYRVDLLTRQILSPEVDWSYGEPIEMLTTGNYDDVGGGESSGAYIVRIPCGPREQYIRKELLWPYVPEFVDGALAHVVHMSKVLGEQMGSGSPVWPHMIHGHYADAGDISSLLSGALNVPMVLTGHSLGRNKLEQLLKQGRQSRESIDSTYKIMRRIEAEEFSLDAAELVVTSTKQEIEQQWGLYDGFDVKLERVLRARGRRGLSCHGRYMPRMEVIPPGMDFSNVVAEVQADESPDLVTREHGPHTPYPAIWTEVLRFFSNHSKPIILALARPDPKKNLLTLVKAYGECAPLREVANLVLIMGNRDDIDNMASGNAEILTSVLKLIDKYNMYGQVAYPKHHKQQEVPEIYRLAAKSKGVFVNPALVEPFGLTLIEAAAHGLPMVATKNGGPVDIQKALSNGILVDPHDQGMISECLLKLVTDRELWEECRNNGLQNIHVYSWPGHCSTYLSKIAKCRSRHPRWRGDSLMDTFGDSDSQGDSLRDMKDLSLMLSVDGKSLGGTGNSLTSGADLERLLAEREKAIQQQPALNRRSAGQRSTGLQPMSEEEGGHLGKVLPASSVIQRRKSLVVVAVDSYKESGEPNNGFCDTLKWVVSAVHEKRVFGHNTGVAIATALTGVEVVGLLSSSGVSLDSLDVIIAGSGSEVYYVANGQLMIDSDYEAHIEYRWGGDGLRKSMGRVISAAKENGDVNGGGGGSPFVEESNKHSTRRLTYRVTNMEKASTTEELRKRLRMRGLRCHAVYCKGGLSLHLLPLHASRAQALRYLFVRWGLDLSKMVVIVGPSGDGDYSELLSGTHHTCIVGVQSSQSPGSNELNLAELTGWSSNIRILDAGKGVIALEDAVQNIDLH